MDIKTQEQLYKFFVTELDAATITTATLRECEQLLVKKILSKKKRQSLKHQK